MNVLKNKMVGNSTKEITTEQIHDFFDKLIKLLNDDKNSMLIGTAPEEKAQMYEKLILGDNNALDELLLKQKSIKLLGQMFETYINELLKFKKVPQKLAFSFEPNKISVFAVIKDGDKELAKNLIMAEASIVPYFFPRGFKMSTMIVEESDNLEIPQGYSEFPIFSKK